MPEGRGYMYVLYINNFNKVVGDEAVTNLNINLS